MTASESKRTVPSDPDEDPQIAPETPLREWTLWLDDLTEACSPAMPPLIAALVFVGGLALLLTGSFPEDTWRRAVLRDVLPLPFAEASHLSASLAGLALIVLSRGLAMRMAKARILATLILAAGAVFALLKGLDWEEASLLTGLAVVLTAARAQFFRRGDWHSFRPTRGWIALVVMAVLAVTVIGLLGYRNVTYRSELWWSFAWHGDAPRFLRVTLALAVAVAVLALDSLVNRPAPTQTRAEPVPDAVRRLVAESPQSARHLALLGDKEFLVAPDGQAFLMYGVEGRSWICLGGPVGSAAACEKLAWTFLEHADRAGARPVFCSITPDRITQLLDIGHAIIKMGELARVDLAAFSLIGPQRKDLRYARSRAERDGLEFALLPRADVPAHIADLRAVSEAWLATRKGREKGFALGYFDDAYLAEFDLAVMRREGRIVAFANLCRGAPGTELSIDLMRHLPGQSPVLMDAMMTEIILLAQAGGFRWFSLGGAPLAGLPDHPLAPLWARIGALIYRRGDDFYSFGGLRAFKDKFGPVWSPLYLTCPGSRSIPRVLLDVALLVSRPRGPATVQTRTKVSA